MDLISDSTTFKRKFPPQMSQPSINTCDQPEQYQSGNVTYLEFKTSISDNLFTAPIPTTTGFLSLPRELRQKILQCAFQDAAIDDNTLHGFLRYSYLGLTRVSTGQRIHLAVKSYTGRLEGCFKLRGKYAPHIHALASKLVGVHPSMFNDLAYVVNKALDYLQEIKQEERAEIVQGLSQSTEAAKPGLGRGRFAGRSRLTNKGTHIDDTTFIHLFPDWEEIIEEA